MDCNRIRERLDEYILGGLELPGRAMVAMHVANCYECREELRELEVLLNELVPTLRHPLPVDHFENLLEAIEHDRRQARASIVDRAWRRRILHRSLAMAAAVALLLLTGPWISHMVSAPFEDPASSAEAAVQSIPAAGLDLKSLIEKRNSLEKSLLDSPQTAPLEVPVDAPGAPKTVEEADSPWTDWSSQTIPYPGAAPLIAAA